MDPDRSGPGVSMWPRENRLRSIGPPSTPDRHKLGRAVLGEELEASVRWGG